MQNVELEHFINSLLLCNVLNSCLSVPSWLCRCDSLSLICCRLRQYAKRRTRAFHQLSSAMQCAQFLPVCAFLAVQVRFLISHLLSFTTICKTSNSSISSTLFCYAMCSIPACLCLPGCAGAIPYQSFAVVYDIMQNVELEHFINSLFCYAMCSIPACLCLPGCAGAIPYQSFAVVYDNMQNVELEHFINSLLLCNVLNSCLSVPSWLCRCDSLSVICCRLRQYAKRRTRAFHQLSSAMQCAQFLPVCAFLAVQVRFLISHLLSFTTICKTSNSSISSTLFCYAMCSIPACLCLPGCAGAIPYQSFAVVYDNMQNVDINSLLLCNVLNSCLSVPSW